jgi:hypothetical protein
MMNMSVQCNAAVTMIDCLTTCESNPQQQKCLLVAALFTRATNRKQLLQAGVAKLSFMPPSYVCRNISWVKVCLDNREQRTSDQPYWNSNHHIHQRIEQRSMTKVVGQCLQRLHPSLMLAVMLVDRSCLAVPRTIRFEQLLCWSFHTEQQARQEERRAA